MKKITYLGIPYTWNPDKSFEIANKVAAKLIQKGMVVFSPISHSHPIADHMSEDLRTSQELWLGQDVPILSKCDSAAFIVIGKEGKRLIRESKGCQRELSEAEKLNLPIHYYYYHGESDEI